MKKTFYVLAGIIVSAALYSCGGAEKATTLADSSSSVPPISPYSPIDKGSGILVFNFNGLYFEADSKNAGRISAFALDGKNMLSSKEINATNWGTSLWPSPQSAWGWPPSKELDVKPYSGGVKDSLSMEFISEKDSLLGFVFAKNYKANPEDTSILITYTITNNSEKTQSVAPWEISRVAPGGLTLYPTGNGKKQNLLAKLMEDKDNITWFKYDSTKMNFKPSDVPKLIHDGAEGWMAQVNGDIVLIKKFIDVTVEKTAPGEGEIEFYANPDKSYIEIEQQGEYTALEAGESLQWEVKWYLRKLPAGAKAEVGNKELVSFIRTTIK
jgi:hypothetical protein